jgi:ABC-type Fe3+-hydroxamate transport system substrate-binding protein
MTARSGPPLRIAILNGGGDHWWIASRKYYLSPLLAAVHAENAGGPVFSAATEETLERLLVSDPDIVLLDSDDLEPRLLYEKLEYRALRAVRMRRVYSLPEHRDASAATQELLIAWLAELCAPERNPPQLREAYRTAYREEFNYAISEDELDRSLRLAANSGSAHYARFRR